VTVLAVEPAPARIAGIPPPMAKTPVSLKYSGTFDMSNKLVPQSSPSSYAYHVEWAFFWSGRWSQLFRDKARFNTNATPFAQRTVSGSVRITFREKVGGPTLRCTLNVVDDPGVPPTFALSYDTSAETLRADVTAPTFRGTKIVPAGPNSTKPGCTGGPGVNVFSAPASFNPLGRGATVSLKTGGTRRYDRAWRWTHAFSGAKRTYSASLHTEVAIVLRRS
jgi:hypothetical protein